MRRADRLFQLLQLLRGGCVHTAASLAAELEVSERTLYRDIRDLMASGVPVEGEAGVGYMMREGFDLPPLMFTENEIEALVLGARMVEAWADERLAKNARSVLSKVHAILPPELAERLNAVPLYAIDFHVPARLRANLKPVREAIAARQRLRFEYTRADGEATQRVARPLGLYFWGQTWTLVAWCELRNDFRNFRPDRMRSIETLEGSFPVEAEKELETFLARRRASDEM